VLSLGGGPQATTIELAIFQALSYDYDPGARRESCGSRQPCSWLVPAGIALLNRWLSSTSVRQQPGPANGWVADSAGVTAAAAAAGGGSGGWLARRTARCAAQSAVQAIHHYRRQRRQQQQ
jgi:ABC-type Fe3+ transport system permease subunit